VVETVNLGDVRVVQRGEDPCLLLKSRNTNRIGGWRARQNLDGDVTKQCDVACLIHLAHAAAADQRDDFVNAEPSTWDERQSGFLNGGIIVEDGATGEEAD